MKLTKRHIQLEELDEDGYWIYLKPGLKDGNDPLAVLHTIHEDTRKEAYRHEVLICLCDDCRREDGQ